MTPSPHLSGATNAQSCKPFASLAALPENVCGAKNVSNNAIPESLVFLEPRQRLGLLGTPPRVTAKLDVAMRLRPQGPSGRDVESRQWLSKAMKLDVIGRLP
jgi:hypothetical protein